MAITTTDSTTIPTPFSIGDGVIAKVMNYRAISGATTGTVTASGMSTAIAIMLDGQIKQTAAESFSGNVATLAFSVPAETAASLVKGGVTYTAVADLGQDGNSITVTYTGGATAGAEIVTVVGTAISVQLESGVSTVTQVRTAVNASVAAAALVVATGTSGVAVSSATVTPLTGGVTGGSRGTLVVLGRV